MKNTEEIWKDVVGYEGLYEVSDYGRVRSHKDKRTTAVVRGKTVERAWKPRILKNKNPSGRDIRVSLWKDKNPKDFLVHRLVAIAFLPKVEGKNYVNHIDGNPKNNHISNLEWCNHTENNNHAFDTGLIQTGRKVVLVNRKSLEAIYFRSATKASHFLGKNDKFISNLLAKGKSSYKGFDIYVKIDQIS